jgi:hypothetical protein
LVSGRTVVILAIGVALLSFSIPWAEAVSSNGFVDALFTPANLASAVGNQYGPCGCPASSEFIQGVALEAIVPSLVSVTFLAAGAWIFPPALLLAFLSILRWKVMMFSGLLFFAAGASWIVGIAAEANHVNSILAQWTGHGPGYVPPTIGAYFGPYLSAIAGVILATGYLLTWRDVVERPLD